MMNRFAFIISFLPLFYLILFYLLVIRFKLKFEDWPIHNPIDPKNIGFEFHISLLDIILVYLIILIPVFGVRLILKLMKRQNMFSEILYFSNLILFIIAVRFDSNFFWFFD